MLSEYLACPEFHHRVGGMITVTTSKVGLSLPPPFSFWLNLCIELAPNHQSRGTSALVVRAGIFTYNTKPQNSLGNNRTLTPVPPPTAPLPKGHEEEEKLLRRWHHNNMVRYGAWRKTPWVLDPSSKTETNVLSSSSGFLSSN